MSEGVVLAFGQGFATLYGLVVGSFLAVCIVRIPEDRSLLVPSSCPRCGARVAWYDNVPVVSWLVLRGRCRHCGSPISPLYPLVELLGGLLALLVFRHLVPDLASLDAPHALAWATQFAFLSMLVVAAAVDIRHQIIPNETSSYAVPVGVLTALALQWIGYEGWLSVGVRQSVLGAALWGGGFAMMSWITLFLAGRVALGWGDVKLAAMLGAFLGIYPGTFLVVLMGSLIGATVGIGYTIVQRRRAYLPFGPPLAVAGALYVLWGDVLLATIFPGIRL